MIWEKINNIIGVEYTTRSQFLNADIQLEALTKEVKTIKDYIAIKYNQCVLLELSLSSPEDEQLNSTSSLAFDNDVRQKFILRLNELNRVVLSRVWDDSDCDEVVFYNIALLNFKIHNYDVSLLLLDKSLKQEFRQSTSIANANLRLHKRCLKAYCLEYLGLIGEDKTENKLKDAIAFLIGYDIFNNNQNEDDITNVIDKAMMCAKCNENLYGIIQILCNDTAHCMVNELDEFYNEKYITKETYDVYLAEIAHILAHCLSEVRKINIGFKRLHKKHVLFLRISDALMRNLGRDFITCFATLKIENGEYFSALNALITEKEYLDGSRPVDEIEAINKQKIILIDRQIAQINFYIWYFSVFARNQDGGKSKKEFLEYCENTKDPIANTYYQVINMKELLLNAFEELRRNAVISEKNTEALLRAYEFFEKNEPYYSIHTAIFEEWKFLKKTYEVLELCRGFSDPEAKEICFYKLYSELFELYNTPCEHKEVNEKLSEERKKLISHYVFTLSQGAKMICRGNYERLSNSIKTNKIYLSYAIPKKIEDAIPTNISNVVIAVDDDTWEKDLDFIATILANDNKVIANVDKHNIYIDTSGLKDKADFCEQLEELKNENPFSPVYEISNLKTTMLLSSVFSMLEKHLLRLSTPLNSYVISPVKDDAAFDLQSCDKLPFLKEEDFKNVQLGYIPDWDFNFGSCFADSDKTFENSKVLLPEKLLECAKQINYVFYFEAVMGKDGTNCYAFELAQDNPIGRFVFSDAIFVENHWRVDRRGNRITESDIIRAIDTLVREKKTHNFHQGNDGHNCCNNRCCNLFTLADIKKSAYNTLRGYLYSYIGVLLQESEFLMLRDEREQHNAWVVIALKTKMPVNEQMRLCEVFSNVGVGEYIKSNKEIDKLTVEHPLSISELKKRITRYDGTKPYIFISYRSRNGTAELCKPVYQDVLYLQEKFGKYFDVVIDVANFDDKFAENIENYIKDDLCMGAFVYSSCEFLCPITTNDRGEEILIPGDEDRCLKEVNLLMERRKKDGKFFVFPVFLNSQKQKERGFGDTLLELLNGTFDLFRNKHDKARIVAFYKLFGLDEDSYFDEIKDINVIRLEWQSDASHLSIENNLKVALAQNGIEVD